MVDASSLSFTTVPFFVNHTHISQRLLRMAWRLFILIELNIDDVRVSMPAVDPWMKKINFNFEQADQRMRWFITPIEQRSAVLGWLVVTQHWQQETNRILAKIAQDLPQGKGLQKIRLLDMTTGQAIAAWPLDEVDSAISSPNNRDHEIVWHQSIWDDTPVTRYHAGDAPESSHNPMTQGRDGIQEVRRSSQHGKHYTHALIDMRMPPGIDGLETAKQLRRLEPHIKIVFVTAYTDYTNRELQIELPDGFTLLNKPFGREEVLSVL